MELRKRACLVLVSMGLFVQQQTQQSMARGAHERTRRPKPSEIAQTRENQPDKAIVILQTRTHRVTIYGSQGLTRYSVATLEGLTLADKLSAPELQARFPDVYEVVTGVAWAGM